MFSKPEDLSSNLQDPSKKPGVARPVPVTLAPWGGETGESRGLGGLQSTSTFSELSWLKEVRRSAGAEHLCLPVAVIRVHIH